MAQHTQVKHPLVIRQVDVIRVADVTPRMRRITLSGSQLNSFSNGEFDLPGFVSDAFDDHIKLVFAANGDIASALPVQRARSIDWPPSEYRQGRDYSVRRWDPATGELDVDFVLHGDGPAATWANAARPGDTLHFAGPKSSLILPDDVDWIVLAGDETALPAIGRFLDERPIDVPARVVVEVRDDNARQDLALAADDTIRWIVTDAHAPSAIGSAVQELAWWPGRPYVWVAGESRSLISLRSWLRRDRNIPSSHLNVTGYWHAQPATATVAATQHGRPAPAVDTETLLSPLPWLATRAAMEIGLLDSVTSTPCTFHSLANKIDVGVGNLRSLVAYLATIEVLHVDDHGVSTGPVGEEIIGDDHLRAELFGTGLETRTLHALWHLGPAIRDGVSAWTKTTGRTLATDIEWDPRLYADLLDQADTFAFVAAALADLPAWKEATRVVVTGPGSLVLVDAIKDAGTLPGIVITGSEMPLSVLVDKAVGLPARFADPDEAVGADLVVSTLETRYRDDVELVAHLSSLKRHGNRVLLVDALQRTGPGSPDAAAEHELIDFAARGTPRRTADDIKKIAREHGMSTTNHVALGWDYEVFELYG